MKLRSHSNVVGSMPAVPPQPHPRAERSPQPPARPRFRLIETGAIWPWVARNLLVLFIVSHHILFVVAVLRAVEVAFWLAFFRQNQEWLPVDYGLAALLVCLAFLVAMRLWSDLPALVTPWLDPDDQEVHGTRLNRENHPDLFRTVEEVAARVGAPIPDEIWISADARCFAFEQRDFAVSTKRTLILVLGLPHLLVMTAAELQVIVGHELAHFRQRDTTLAVFLFRFAQSLRNYLNDTRDHPLRWLNPVYGFEWASYNLFQLLIAPVLRRQEIKADCRSAEAFGGDLARRTLLKDWLVSSQFAALLQQRLEDSRSGRPADERTVYEQFVAEWREVSPTGREYLRQRLDELERESYWDTHPSLNRRLRAVAAYPNIGFEDGQPALNLLGDKHVLLRTLGDKLAAELNLFAHPMATAG